MGIGYGLVIVVLRYQLVKAAPFTGRIFDDISWMRVRKDSAIPRADRKRELRLLGMFQPRERRHCLNRMCGGMMMRDAMTTDKTKSPRRNNATKVEQTIRWSRHKPGGRKIDVRERAVIKSKEPSSRSIGDVWAVNWVVRLVEGR